MGRAVCRRWRHTLDTHRFLQQASLRVSSAQLGEVWRSDVIRLVGTILICRGQQQDQEEDYDGRGQQTASPMLTAIMSGGVGICGRELYKYR